MELVFVFVVVALCLFVRLVGWVFKKERRFLAYAQSVQTVISLRWQKVQRQCRFLHSQTKQNV